MIHSEHHLTDDICIRTVNRSKLYRYHYIQNLLCSITSYILKMLALSWLLTMHMINRCCETTLKYSSTPAAAWHPWLTIYLLIITYDLNLFLAIGYRLIHQNLNDTCPIAADNRRDWYVNEHIHVWTHYLYSARPIMPA